MESSFIGAYNVQEARQKRVFFKGAAETILEGAILTYNVDATADLNGTTVAAGDCNPAKWTEVQKPVTADLKFVAGVVAGSSYAGKLGDRWVDIYVPNGALVPCRGSASFTKGDAVYVNNADYTVSKTTTGEFVGWAAETIDRSTTNGLVLVKLVDSGLKAAVALLETP
jgi:hypothetical protein